MSRSNHFLLKKSRDQSITNSTYPRTPKYFQYFIFHYWNQSTSVRLYRELFIITHRKRIDSKLREFQKRKISDILSSGRNTLQQRTHGNLLATSTIVTPLSKDSTNIRKIIQHSERRPNDRRCSNQGIRNKTIERLCDIRLLHPGQKTLCLSLCFRVNFLQHLLISQQSRDYDCQHNFILSDLRGQVFPNTIQRNPRHVNTRFISANTFRALHTRRRVFHRDAGFTRTRATLTSKVNQYIVTIDFESKTNTTLLLIRHDKCKESLFETKRSRKGIVLRPQLVIVNIYSTKRYVARSTTTYMFDDLAGEQCSTCQRASSTCSTANRASKARHARQRARRAGLDMLDSEHGEQGKNLISIQIFEHDSLMNRVQLILSLDLLLRLLKLQSLVTK